MKTKIILTLAPPIPTLPPAPQMLYGEGALDASETVDDDEEGEEWFAVEDEVECEVKKSLFGVFGPDIVLWTLFGFCCCCCCFEIKLQSIAFVFMLEDDDISKSIWSIKQNKEWN